MSVTPDHLPIIRHRIEDAEVYEVFVDELDRLETECESVGLTLQFATFFAPLASVITSKAANEDHFKTGQRDDVRDMDFYSFIDS
jgi:hypothetical protein